MWKILASILKTTIKLLALLCGACITLTIDTLVFIVGIIVDVIASIADKTYYDTNDCKKRRNDRVENRFNKLLDLTISYFHLIYS